MTQDLENYYQTMAAYNYNSILIKNAQMSVNLVEVRNRARLCVGPKKPLAERVWSSGLSTPFDAKEEKSGNDITETMYLENNPLCPKVGNQ